MSFFYSAYISCKLNNSQLHAKAQSKIWYCMFPTIFNSLYFSLYSPIPKTSGNNETVKLSQFLNRRWSFLIFFSRQPGYLRTSFLRPARVFNGLYHGNIRVHQGEGSRLKIFPHYSDMNF